MLEQCSSVPRLYYLTKSVATFLALIALLRADAPMIAAGAPRPEIPSTQEIAVRNLFGRVSFGVRHSVSNDTSPIEQLVFRLRPILRIQN